MTRLSIQLLALLVAYSSSQASEPVKISKCFMVQRGDQFVPVCPKIIKAYPVSGGEK